MLENFCRNTQIGANLFPCSHNYSRYCASYTNWWYSDFFVHDESYNLPKMMVLIYICCLIIYQSMITDILKYLSFVLWRSDLKTELFCFKNYNSPACYFLRIYRIMIFLKFIIITFNIQHNNYTPLFIYTKTLSLFKYYFRFSFQSAIQTFPILFLRDIG